jgi:hypothetical protein
MLPSDAPFLETALALLASPFRPVTAGCLVHSICGKYSQCVMPDTRSNPLTLSAVGRGGGGPTPLVNQQCW